MMSQILSDEVIQKMIKSNLTHSSSTTTNTKVSEDSNISIVIVDLENGVEIPVSGNEECISLLELVQQEGEK